ncbi:hypothetical protein ILUMI_05244 [Ignelater luminosus]|uniref:Asparagine synthetase [glutamine-hydrolyzing] n=1 Tax=Ignelater luminosus TaxID=2038154 RepID=A0A8K0DBD7_IGNLU|nr:hypothetical protein ILUMI_05244 [Ignelater luminosus]
MCGIWAVFGLQSNLHEHCGCSFTKITHRGPDAWRVEYDKRIKNCCVGFHRLTIVDCTYGMQPMKLHQYPHSMLVCNGELYNCKRIAEQFDFKYETYSDVECIFHLYQKLGIEECVKNLDGVFAFCLVDVPKRRVLLGRDPYGVRPLFRLHSRNGVLAICSEAKGIASIAEQLNGEGRKLEPFPPGTFEEYELLENGTTKLLHQEIFHKPGDRPSFRPFMPYEDLTNDTLANIRELFTMAIRKRLMADRRIGCLLSGGLDSSLVASLLVQEAKRANLPYKIQSFSVGMGDSPDIKAAREVAKHIGTEHHEVIFTEEDIANCLDDVIYHLETYDITTVRASIGMYLISKYVLENTETTVLFSGEGADELCQGYIYFRDAPNADAAHEESLRLLREIYLFDGLRADRTMSAQSLELRVPFLDLQFTNYYLSLPKELRQPKDMKLEKYLLRSAFEGTNILPHDILWRHKEAFSDGVASQKKSLFTIIQEIVDKRMPEQFDIKVAQKKYPHCTPKTKESYYYREAFEKSYPKLAESFIPFFWMPRWINVDDPSARFISHYAANKETDQVTKVEG